MATATNERARSDGVAMDRCGWCRRPVRLPRGGVVADATTAARYGHHHLTVIHDSPRTHTRCPKCTNCGSQRHCSRAAACATCAIYRRWLLHCRRPVVGAASFQHCTWRSSHRIRAAVPAAHTQVAGNFNGRRTPRRTRTHALIASKYKCQDANVTCTTWRRVDATGSVRRHRSPRGR